VAKRLSQYLDLEATPLYHPPPNADRLWQGKYGDYLFAPGRINPSKRLELILRGLAATRSKIRLVIAGVAENPAYQQDLHALALELGVANRVTWLGRVDDETLLRHYAEARAVVDSATRLGRKLVVGYILRHHPGWIRLIAEARALGGPYVFRLNLNQQSDGPTWAVHKALMRTTSPIVDCGVHYVDVMCQLTGAKPVRVHGIGAALWAEADKQNYGHLHVTFDDGSVGWYEAGWGPMMSETAFFVKDVVGPKGSVSLVPDPNAHSDKDLSDSADIDKHTKTDAIRVHHADVGADKNFTKADEILSMEDEPGHQELCDREQDFFLKAIREDLDLTESMDAAVNSLRIVLAAEESIEKEQVIRLD